MALAELGHDVRVCLPRYGGVDPGRWGFRWSGVERTIPLGPDAATVGIWEGTLPDTLVPVYLLEHEASFGHSPQLYRGHDQPEEQRRFLIFCRGLLEALPALDFAPDVFHLNDWQTAPCAAYLRTTHRHLLREGAARVVYTIHNLQYQGRWDPSVLDLAGLDRAWVFGPEGLEYWGDVNWMKAGIVYADAITTVSRRYAEEIQTLDQGWGLDEVLARRHSRLFGIPNGIDWDAWNPASDPDLAATYGPATAASGKQRNRAALRRELGLPAARLTPVVGMVTRLVDQKGIDLLAALASELPQLPLQLVVLGAGHAPYEALFRDLSAAHGNVRAIIGYNAPLSHRIYAGSDLFLMPSAFEPGGLGQLIAMRYGTVPVVRATGGLADTVADVDADPVHGTGFSFTEYTPEALLAALRRALARYADREAWPEMVARAMAYDSRWSASARAYADLYTRVLRLPRTGVTG
jgi:starch synthase